MNIYIKIEDDAREESALENSILILRHEIADNIPGVSIIEADTHPPSGSRSATAITAGMVAVALLPVAVDKLIDLFIHWARRDKAVGERRIQFLVEEGDKRIAIELDADKFKSIEIKRILKNASDTVSKIE